MSILKTIAALILIFLSAILFSLNVTGSEILKVDPKFVHLNEIRGQRLGQVNALLQDSMGFVWIATEEGLLRYDGYDVKRFDTESPSRFIPNNSVVVLSEDGNGNLWLGTYGGGISKLELSTHRTYHYQSKQSDPQTLNSNYIWSFHNSGTFLWAGTSDGLNIFDTQSGKNHRVSHANEIPMKVEQAGVWDIFEDSNGDYWLSTLGEGVYKYDANTEKVTHLKRRENKDHIVNNFVRTVSEDKSGNIWIGTDGGISIYNPASNTFSNHVHLDNQVSSLSHNEINVIFNDSNDNVWVGTYGGGLNLYNAKNESFVRFNKGNHLSNQFDAEIVYSIMEDQSGTLWFATENGVYLLPNGASNFQQYSDNTNSKFSVSSVFEDSNRNLWVGSNSGVLKYNSTTKKWNTQIREVVDVSAFAETPNGNIWFGSKSRGLFELIQGDTRDFELSANESGLLSQSVYSLAVDETGQLWVGLAKQERDKGGFTVLNKSTESHQHFLTQMNVVCMVHIDDRFLLVGTNDRGVALFDKVEKKVVDTPKLRESKAQHINTIFKDHETRVWIGTENEGLWEYEHANRALFYHEAIDIKIIKGITRASDGSVWIGGVSSLLKYPQDGSQVQAFNSADGLYDTSIQQGAMFATDTGEVYFGTHSGLTKFSPYDFVEHQRSPSAALTDLKILNQSVGVSDNTVLSREINRQKQLELTYDDYFFSITFSALDFSKPYSAAYRYRMQGLDKSWIHTDSFNRVATYTTLPAGDYTFTVSSRTKNSEWSSEKSIDIRVIPPFWQTWQAYSIYFLSLFTIMALFYFNRERNHRKREIQLENAIKERTNELQLSRDELEAKTHKINELLLFKQNMFAHVSHEFRTPLTLILSPADQMIGSLKNDEHIYSASLIKRNALKLLKLVEQLLMFAKLDSPKVLAMQKYVVSKVLNDILEAFYVLAKAKNIRIAIDRVDECVVTLKEGSLELILSNLLSNAIKYTHDKGNIRVSIFVERETLTIMVSDDGIGIERHHLLSIFERFKRLPDSVEMAENGTGLGLALVKEFVEANKGTLDVSSEKGKGSTFIVTLPVVMSSCLDTEDDDRNYVFSDKTAFYDRDIEATEREPKAQQSMRALSFERGKETGLLNKRSILIIEDNKDMRLFLRDSLSKEYKCLLAKNGEQGFEAAIEHIPDLIICDLMMPIMDGFEVTKMIRENDCSCHIPIIMLTAKGDLNSRMLGWKENVDEYIAKPFELNELKLRIINLLSIRDIIRTKIGKQLGAAAPFKSLEPKVKERDKAFVLKFEKIISDNFHDQEFNRHDAAELMFIGERQLNRKLSALVDHNFSEYLRKYRLRQVISLLGQNYTIPEIAEAVGFSSHSYLSSCFKKEYGVTIKQYEEKLIKQTVL